jgi:hypothetical protein
MLSVLNGSLVSYLPHRFNVPASRGRNAFPGSRKVIDVMRLQQGIVGRPVAIVSAGPAENIRSTDTLCGTKVLPCRDDEVAARE